MGSMSRSAASMLAYCEPWPVYRKATFGAGPLPRKMPRPAQGLPAARLREGGERLLEPCRRGRRHRRSRWRRARRHADRPRAVRRAAGACPATASACAATQARDERRPRRRRRGPSAPRSGAFGARAGRVDHRPDRRCGRDRFGLGRRQLGAHRHDLAARPWPRDRARTPRARRGSWCRRTRRRSRRRCGHHRSGGSQGRSSVFTANGDALQSMLGLSSSTWRLGGSSLWWIASHGLEEAGGPGGRLEVTDVRLGRADRHRSRAEIGATERLADARHLDDVADARRRAVALDHPARRSGDSPALCQARSHGQPLTDRDWAR